MFTQTIALFRYQLLGIINSRILLLTFTIYVTAFLAGQFMGELAIINSETIALSMMADFLRYSLVLLVIISLGNQISQDYELSQFERLLAMPIGRGQYLLAQSLVLITFVAVLVLPFYLVMIPFAEPSLAGYWVAAVFLELVLVGQFSVLSILSLEKLPVAVIFTLAVYLLAKVAPLMDLVFRQSLEFYEQEQEFQITHFIFSSIQYVLPDANAFAQNNVIFKSMEYSALLWKQLINVVIYGAFIQCIILIDFYRKEFNRT